MCCNFDVCRHTEKETNHLITKRNAYFYTDKIWRYLPGEHALRLMIWISVASLFLRAWKIKWDFLLNQKLPFVWYHQKSVPWKTKWTLSIFDTIVLILKTNKMLMAKLVIRTIQCSWHHAMYQIKENISSVLCETQRKMRTDKF